MIITANISPLIPNQFPKIYEKDAPNFINFVKAYYQWMEQANNVTYYARNTTQIRDIDDTFAQFIVYFKDKYLNNIRFNTITDIRMVIKHALDIYRSKGTERCVTLIFQEVFGQLPQFYYPSTDLMKLSDGQWIVPPYLELSENWQTNILLQNKEVQGAFSNAIAFIDSIVRRTTNGRFEDIAYISAVEGEFQTGEKIVPTDGSLPIANCPVMIGSLTSILIPSIGSGNNYTNGSVIPVSSVYGTGGQVLISNTINQTGTTFNLQFQSGGFGYTFAAQQASMSYSHASASFANGTNIYTYFANGSVDGIALVFAANAMVSNAGVMTVNCLSGNINHSEIYTFGNAQSANNNTAAYSTANLSPNVYVSNSLLTIANFTMNTANNEDVHYFPWLDQITEPMATYNYVDANGTFQPGSNLIIWSNSTSQQGSGVIMSVNPTANSNGTIIMSVTSGNVVPNNSVNSIVTTGNTIGANLLAATPYVNSTATGTFIANADVITLTISNVVGTFIENEEIFQTVPDPIPYPVQKVGGWGTLTAVGANTITVSNVNGRFIAGPLVGISGSVSNTTATVVNVTITIGLINLSSNAFVVSPYGVIQSALTQNGVASSYTLSSNSFTITLVSNVANPQVTQLNTDVLSTYSSVALAAATYGFPANPNANTSTGVILSTMNFLDTTIGSLSNVIVSGAATSFTGVPYIVVDYPYVSGAYIYNDVLQVTGQQGQFATGEIITQLSSNITAVVISESNNFLEVYRLDYGAANDFVITANANSIITGVMSGASANIVAVDYDYMSPIMGRNANVSVSFLVANNALTGIKVVDSGFGFVNGESIIIGSNGAIGIAIVSGQGYGAGYYKTVGGFLSDRKKLFDGYFYQNFSYQIISPVMLSLYQEMLTDLTHVAGTIMFGQLVHNAIGNKAMDVQSSVLTIH